MRRTVEAARRRPEATAAVGIVEWAVLPSAAPLDDDATGEDASIEEEASEREEEHPGKRQEQQRQHQPADERERLRAVGGG